MQCTVVLVVGTRPNFVKAAPVLHALQQKEGITTLVVHSGQHFDAALSQDILQDLRMPPPDLVCDTRDTDGWNAEKFSEQFLAFLQEHTPSMVLVFGDVDTTRIAAEVTSASGIPLAHVESGLRSFDSRMPEEANRIRTDSLADLLFVTEQSGIDNIQKEKLDGAVHLVGNTMIDSLHTLRASIEERSKDLEDTAPSLVVTLHRRETILDKEVLEMLLQQLTECSKAYRIIWPLHPHTEKMIHTFDLSHYLEAFEMKASKGYIDFLAMVSAASAVVTDSGGLQEETTCLGIPCFTLRESTERPVTVEQGTNTLIPPSSLKDSSLLSHIQLPASQNTQQPDLWDGKAATRIAENIHTYLEFQGARTGISTIGRRL